MEVCPGTLIRTASRCGNVVSYTRYGDPGTPRNIVEYVVPKAEFSCDYTRIARLRTIQPPPICIFEHPLHITLPLSRPPTAFTPKCGWIATQLFWYESSGTKCTSRSVCLQLKFTCYLFNTALPLQVHPSPKNPMLQVQQKLPGKFVQLAFASHPPLSVEHSSMSAT